MEKESPRLPTGFVDSVFHLRMHPIPIAGTRILVRGFHGPESQGGGWFAWDAECTLSDDGGTVICPREEVCRGRWLRQQDGPITPLWFGALGKNTARSPKEDRRDIHEDPYNDGARFFSNTDSWDAIGMQLAFRYLERHGGMIHIPTGTYRITFPLTLRVKGKAIVRGEGSSKSILVRDNHRFVGDEALITLEEIVGMPLTIQNLCFRGIGDEAGGPAGGAGLTLLRLRDVAGVRIEDCWLSHAGTGIEFLDHCEDWAVRECTVEACDMILSVSEGSWGVVEGNDFWQTSAEENYVGIMNRGSLICSHNQFMGFHGCAIDSVGEAHVSGNYIESTIGQRAVRAERGLVADNGFSPCRIAKVSRA